jgi:hypothetical protein
MKVTALLIFLFSNQGYWFAAQEGTISVSWAVEGGLPRTRLNWELMADTVRLDQGQVDLQAGAQATRIALRVPGVRTRVRLHWVYHLLDIDTTKELATGQADVQVFPRTLTDDWKKLSGGKSIYVWDAPDGMPRILTTAHVAFTRISGTRQLQLQAPDVILVAQNQLAPDPLDGSLLDTSALLTYARAGASVMIMRQQDAAALCACALTPRRSEGLQWRLTHPLLAGFDADDCHSWFAGEPQPVLALRLGVGEPALELAYWPRETPGPQPAPIDAVLLTKTVGSGRIVLCQIPLGDWQQDPRSQMFLGNALAYLVTRPEPTPPPGQRGEAESRRQMPTSVPTVNISSGD